MASVGAPRFFETPEDMQALIAGYWDECKAKEERPLISGLAYHLGFESRQSFYDYEKKPEFAYTIKRARLAIEIEYEKRVGEGSGFIFALKNFGWTDKTEIDNTHTYPKGIKIEFIKSAAADIPHDSND